MSTVNFMYDKRNSFGELAAAGEFPNTIGMGDATAERMAVDLKLPDGSFASAAGVTLSIEGCATETGTYAAIVTSGTITAAMANEGYGLPIPKTGHKFLKAKISGTFTGKVQAIINSYLGK